MYINSQLCRQRESKNKRKRKEKKENVEKIKKGNIKEDTHQTVENLKKHRTALSYVHIERYI